MSYIPLPYLLILGGKRPFQHPIHNSFFLMLMLLFGDIHVNPGPSNAFSISFSSQPPNFAVAMPPSAATAAVDSDPPSPPPAPPPHPHNDSTNNKFKLCTLNIRSLLHPIHAAEINDLALSPHPPDRNILKCQYNPRTIPGLHTFWLQSKQHSLNYR